VRPVAVRGTCLIGVKRRLIRLAVILTLITLVCRTHPALAEPAGRGAAAPADAGCLATGDASLRARLRGAIDADVDWHGNALECEGMPRPDRAGVRAHFRGRLPDGRMLALLFAATTVAPGETRQDAPVNLTLLVEDTGEIYGTLGGDRCRLDRVVQRELPSPIPGARRFRVEGHGFCHAPARALHGTAVVLVNRFDFVGRVDVRPEDGPAAETP
jgi:hypothetical protein